ncbi:MAG: hypothetical protein MI724_07275 [Spirochaetales bacterium]|nr:hypothetical protein [Spirochaetales bacterium]
MPREDDYACYTKVRRIIKYQLHCDFVYHTTIDTRFSVDTAFISLRNGTLTIRKGFLWDGPTAGNIWAKLTGNRRAKRMLMRGSLVHDALYDLIRMNKFADKDQERHVAEIADVLLRRLITEDGIPSHEAEMIDAIVERFQKLATARPELNRSRTRYAGNPDRFPKKDCRCGEEPR